MFYLAVKSTVDRQAYALSQQLNITHCLDVDDSTNIEEAMASSDSVLLWQLITFTEEPRDPLYRMVMGFGIKTSQDPSNYRMSAFVSQIRAQLPIETSIPIHDYSGAAGADIGPALGHILITNSSIQQQQADFNSGIRMYTVEAVLYRNNLAGV